MSSPPLCALLTLHESANYMKEIVTHHNWQTLKIINDNLQWFLRISYPSYIWSLKSHSLFLDIYVFLMDSSKSVCFSNFFINFFLTATKICKRIINTIWLNMQHHVKPCVTSSTCKLYIYLFIWVHLTFTKFTNNFS